MQQIYEKIDNMTYHHNLSGGIIIISISHLNQKCQIRLWYIEL